MRIENPRSFYRIAQFQILGKLQDTVAELLLITLTPNRNQCYTEKKRAEKHGTLKRTV